MSKFDKIRIKELDYIDRDSSKHQRKGQKLRGRQIKRSEKNQSRIEIEALICEMDD